MRAGFGSTWWRGRRMWFWRGWGGIPVLRRDWPWRFPEGWVTCGIQRISQDKLDAGLTTGQTQVFCLFRGHQQVHHLDLLWLSFPVFLNVGASRQNLNILK